MMRSGIQQAVKQKGEQSEPIVSAYLILPGFESGIKFEWSQMLRLIIEVMHLFLDSMFKLPFSVSAIYIHNFVASF